MSPAIAPLRLPRLLALLLILFPRFARAELAEPHANDAYAPPEHTLIVGIGGAAEMELADGSFHPGTTLMIEWDAIESWPELELGASLLAGEGGLEIPVDLLFKKPFTLTRWAEMMIGAGPEIVQVTGAGKGTYFGGEAALDFMFWPWGRRVGLWIEPEYDLVFHGGATSGVGGTGGLLLGW